MLYHIYNHFPLKSCLPCPINKIHPCLLLREQRPMSKSPFLIGDWIGVGMWSKGVVNDIPSSGNLKMESRNLMKTMWGARTRSSEQLRWELTCEPSSCQNRGQAAWNGRWGMVATVEGVRNIEGERGEKRRGEEKGEDFLYFLLTFHFLLSISYEA